MNQTDKIRVPRGHWRHRFATAEAYDWTVSRWRVINQRTVNGLYALESASSKNPQHISYLRKGIRIEISQEDFFDFCSDNEQKILQMMADDLRPTIDRIDIDGHYSLENIQIISLAENLSKDRNGTTSSESKVGDLVIRLRNRKKYLETHPDTKTIRFSDKLLKMGSLAHIVDAIGVWNPLLDEPYTEDTESEAWKAYSLAICSIKEAFSARQRKVDLAEVLNASREARRKAREARKPIQQKIEQAQSEYRRLKLWAKTKPEYEEVYAKCCEDRELYPVTPQRRAMDLLKEMYEGKDGCYNY